MFYGAVRILFRAIARPLFAFRVEGVESVPREGPGVVVALHRSWLDPVAIGGAFPRPVRFLVRGRVYERWWARWFYRAMGAIPVGDGAPGIAALRGALRRMREGEIVGVFPQGTIRANGAMGPLYPGAALLAVHGRGPVIPVAIRGSSRAWPHGRRLPRRAPVAVKIGDPIPPPTRGPGGSLEEMLLRIEGALRALAEDAEVRA